MNKLTLTFVYFCHKIIKFNNVMDNNFFTFMVCGAPDMCQRLCSKVDLCHVYM